KSTKPNARRASCQIAANRGLRSPSCPRTSCCGCHPALEIRFAIHATAAAATAIEIMKLSEGPATSALKPANPSNCRSPNLAIRPIEFAAAATIGPTNHKEGYKKAKAAHSASTGMVGKSAVPPLLASNSTPTGNRIYIVVAKAAAAIEPIHIDKLGLANPALF